MGNGGRLLLLQLLAQVPDDPLFQPGNVALADADGVGRLFLGVFHPVHQAEAQLHDLAVNTFTPGRNIKLATYASRCIENEILMYFRSQRKTQGELSLSDSLDGDPEGNSLSLMDVVCVDDTMLEDLDLRDSCQRVRECVDTCLTPREAHIIKLRYGLNQQAPLTQREIATLCGISRSYVSRIEKKALEKLRQAYESH